MSPSNSTCVNGSMPSADNGFFDSNALLSSEKSVEELIQQPPLQGIDDHLIEFSEALRTVAKALRRVTEGKASAQAEAAEWKRKYELAREHNKHLEEKGYFHTAHCRILRSTPNLWSHLMSILHAM